MAAEIKDALDIEAELIGGGGGVFDVRAGDQLVFSKGKVGRFPEPDEVLTALERLKKP